MIQRRLTRIEQQILRMRRKAPTRDRTGTGALYYRPSITALHKQGWPEPDTSQLIDKSVSYISIL